MVVTTNRVMIIMVIIRIMVLKKISMMTNNGPLPPAPGAPDLGFTWPNERIFRPFNDLMMKTFNVGSVVCEG